MCSILKKQGYGEGNTLIMELSYLPVVEKMVELGTNR